jgi:hypothetical protein
VDGAKLKMDGEDDGCARCEGDGLDIAGGCRGVGDDNLAKGSGPGGCGEWDFGRTGAGGEEINDGPGVTGRDEEWEGVRDANGL